MSTVHVLRTVCDAPGCPAEHVGAGAAAAGWKQRTAATPPTLDYCPAHAPLALIRPGWTA